MVSWSNLTDNSILTCYKFGNYRKEKFIPTCYKSIFGRNDKVLLFKCFAPEN